MGNNEPAFASGDLLAAEEVLANLSQQLAIRFQLHGDKWSRPEAQKYFADRHALVRIRELLVDEAETITIHSRQ